MPIKYSRKRQQQLCAAWQASNGISLKQFCEDNKISKGSIYKWLRASETGQVVNQEPKLLRAAQEEPNAESLEILLPNGALVRGGTGMMINLIMELLR